MLKPARLPPDVDEIFGRIGTLNHVVQEIRAGRSGRLVRAERSIIAEPRRQ
ncbi:MAG: hypothetical protein ABI624_04710 [Casimicrobiaceae bacterium]